MQTIKRTFLECSDPELVNLLKGGDEKALQAVMSRYWESLYKMAAYTLDDLAACEDIVQEIFIKLWNNRENLNFSHSLRAYLFASVRYEVYRTVKIQLNRDSKIAFHGNNSIEYFNPENKLEYNELMQDIEKLVSQLPQRCKEIYQLSRYDNLSHKEIASRLDISIKTVENQLTIALRRIRMAISKMLVLLFF